eukprot:222672-Rhodomonas_salina.1
MVCCARCYLATYDAATFMATRALLETWGRGASCQGGEPLGSYVAWSWLAAVSLTHSRPSLYCRLATCSRPSLTVGLQRAYFGELTCGCTWRGSACTVAPC